MAASSGRYQRGLFVVVLGPDGCGKSTLVGEMMQRIAADFGHAWRFHWRPGLLPKLSRNSHSAPPTFAPPPDTAAYGHFVSLVRYLYYLSDFVLGYWFVIYPKRRRNGLVIGERWYYDVIVNPARYGFRLPLWLLRAGARFVPNPDLTLLLEADSAAIHERKPELTAEQIHYQLARFRDLLEKIPNSLRVWTGGTLDQSLRAVSNAISNSRARIGPEPASNDSNWSGFPSSARAKLWVDRHDTLFHALNLYHPYSRVGRLSTCIAGFMPRSWVLHGTPNPPDRLRFKHLSDIIHRTLNDGPLTISFSACRPDGKLTAQASRHGRVIAYIKIAYTESDAARLLRREDSFLRRMASVTTVQGMLPRVLDCLTDQENTFLFLSPADDRTHRRSAEADDRDAAFLGSMIPEVEQIVPVDEMLEMLEREFASDSAAPNTSGAPAVLREAGHAARRVLAGKGVRTGPCHGDYAPWNMLETADGRLYVFDWEHATEHAPLLVDLFHRVFMHDWLVRKLRPQQAVQRLLDSVTDPVLGRILLKSRVPLEELPAYVLLYFMRYAWMKQHFEKRVPAYLEVCLRYTQQRIAYHVSRKRVLVSAYACEPDKGSEQAVGWCWVEQISADNEAWVITRRNNRQVIERYLEAHPNPNLRFVYVDLPRWLAFWKRGATGVRTYYYLWQVAALAKAWRLSRTVRFDLGHHVTFVNDWLWSFLCLMPMPYVWGPIGSHPPCPATLLPNARARLMEVVRLLIQRGARLVDPLYWLTAARASFVLTINDYVPRQRPLRWIIRRRQMTESAIAMDTDTVHDDERRYDEPTVLFVGRFHYIKCPHIALEAFARLAAIRKDIRCIMVGKGPEESALRHRANELGLDGRITFAGWTDRKEVLKIMRKSHLFLFPSAEGAGMVVLEAMACGLPVVCLDIGGPGQMVGPGCGAKIPVDSASDITEQLANAMGDILSNPERRESMSNRAREWVQTKYAWRSKKRALLVAYSRTYRERGPGNIGINHE